MTREEAIKALEIELNQWEADCKSYHAVKEALPMAIEALENENALIDRVSEIIDNTKQAFIEDGIEGEAVAVEHAIDRIKELRIEVLALKGGKQG